MFFVFFFFFKQKTAYEMRISDWSSDVCSSDLIMPGAKALVQTMAARGAKTVLVSGGFTRFAEPVGKEIGFERVVANVLDVDAARLTGTVQLPIVDAIRKIGRAHV